ncbi:CGNR zinc finger domain-containing protein [Kitasatospora misakiensis]|uniref:CGNR zinc finger domain-containing protein n=1 Tax=Kitasatospora misakiensis TaxID=67330 RepID=A0ABW0XDG2_9ACTN
MIEPSPAAQLIEAFINTVDLEDGQDDVATPTELARWLADHHLAGDPPHLTAGQQRAFLDLRAGFREALDPDSPVSPHHLAAADAILAEVPLLATLKQPLVPSSAQTPAQTAMAQLAIAWTTLVLTGQIHRLKRCAEHTCRGAFWDSSKNHSRRWCSMRLCGNRTKARRYAARQRH